MGKHEKVATYRGPEWKTVDPDSEKGKKIKAELAAERAKKAAAKEASEAPHKPVDPGKTPKEAVEDGVRRGLEIEAERVAVSRPRFVVRFNHVTNQFEPFNTQTCLFEPDRLVSDCACEFPKPNVQLLSPDIVVAGGGGPSPAEATPKPRKEARKPRQAGERLLAIASLRAELDRFGRILSAAQDELEKTSPDKPTKGRAHSAALRGSIDLWYALAAFRRR